MSEYLTDHEYLTDDEYSTYCEYEDNNIIKYDINSDNSFTYLMNIDKNKYDKIIIVSYSYNENIIFIDNLSLNFDNLKFMIIKKIKRSNDLENYIDNNNCIIYNNLEILDIVKDICNINNNMTVIFDISDEKNYDIDKYLNIIKCKKSIINYYEIYDNNMMEIYCNNLLEYDNLYYDCKINLTLYSWINCNCL